MRKQQWSTVARAGLAAAALYTLAFVALSIGGAKRESAVVAGAAVCMLLASGLLQLALRRARAGGLVSRALLLWGPVAVAVVALGVALYAAFGPPAGGVGFCALCLAYVGAGQALAELRSRTGGAPARGLVVMAVCATVFAAGLALCLFVSAKLLAIAAFGLLGGPIGLTLYSEDVLRARPTWLRRGAGIGAGLVLAGTGLLWTWADIPPGLTVALLVVLFGLVGAIASNTQADVLLVVAVVALVWAASPRPVARDDTISLQPGVPTLVALGDSYMAGEGADLFYEGTSESEVNECRRAPSAYPRLVVAERPAAGLMQLAFFACSGARTPHIYRDAQFPGEPLGASPRGANQLDQLRSALRRPGLDVRLVIVSIGGNDAGFSLIGSACLAPGSCVERGQAWLDKLDEVARNVRTAYREIRGVVGTDVPVLSVPYPVPIRPEPCSYSLLERDEHRFLFRYVRQLNRVIEGAAGAAGFEYLDTMPGAFSTNQKLRICDAPRDKIGVNFVALRSVDRGLVDQAVNPGNWIHNSLHPNERGHRVMADVLADWLDAHPDLEARGAPSRTPPPPRSPSLPELMSTDDLSYCGGRSPPDYCDRDDADWAITQIGLVLAVATLPGVLIVLGSWLLWQPVLARTRPRWTSVGDRTARLLDA